LDECEGVSYKKIAFEAEKKGYNEIALSLLKNEDAIRDQIPVLLKMHQYDIALNIAISNTEADIVYGIISNMRKSGFFVQKMLSYCTQVEGFLPYFLSYARQRRVIDRADNLLSSIYEYLASTDEQVIAKRLVAEGVPEAEEYDTLADALYNTKAKQLIVSLNQIVTLNDKNSFTRIRPYVEGYLNILSFKAEYIENMKKKNKEVDKGFINTESAFQIIMQLAEKKDLNINIDKIIKRLKIEAKFASVLKLRTAAKSDNWKHFHEIILKEKPKLTPEHYAGICIEFNNKTLAAYFIKQVLRPETKIDLYVQIE